ncbi:helix-turn-helix domain-containing protein [Actinopolymorpha pittospori]
MTSPKPGEEESPHSESAQSTSPQSTSQTTPSRAPLSDVRFLTVAEVAAAMRVSKMTVYRLVHAGDLPAVRVGRSFRVPEQAMHDYLRRAYIQAG